MVRLASTTEDHILVDALMVPGVPLSEAQQQELQSSLDRLSVDSLQDPALRSKLWLLGLNYIADTQTPLKMLSQIVRFLFRHTVSGSGADVSVRAPVTAASQSTLVGVLILGFGGSSVQALQEVTDMYARDHPSWRVITTAPHGVRDKRQAHLEHVSQHLQGCQHIVVHSMSNNGYG